MTAWVGIDWSETYQDWAVVDETGAVIDRGRFLETPQDFDRFEAKIRGHADPTTGLLPTVAIETDKGLTVTELQQRGYTIHAINPLKVSRFRDQFQVTKGKSDKSDARMIADILRVAPGVHRPLAKISESGVRLSILARSHQDQVWRVQQIASEMRSVLRLYYPAFLIAYPPSGTKTNKRRNLTSREARTVLAACPTPTQAAAKRLAGWDTLLRKSGRSPGIAARHAPDLRDTFSSPSLRHPPAVEAAYGERALTLLTVLNAAVEALGTIEQEMIDCMHAHPMWGLFDSIPGIGVVTAARLLGEIGDDPHRFDGVESIRSYAGTAPITRASGKARVVTRRKIKNNRLSTATHMWAQNAMLHTIGGRAHYDYRIGKGDRYAAALRNMSNRLIGCLWHCMTTGEVWDEQKVWGHRYNLERSLVFEGADPDDPEERLTTALAVTELLDGEAESA